MFEAELFGYNKGAFTGANQDGKLGYFELAENGTLLKSMYKTNETSSITLSEIN